MRKPRVLKPKAKYHVTARANRREMIFEAPIVKELFLGIMHTAKTKYRFQLFNFCIMGNHIHFLIQPGEKTSLSHLMQWLLSVFAVKYNKLHGYSGHVWYDRFKSSILEDIFHYLNAYIYIMWNPVRAGLAQKPTDYPYNGITFMLKGQSELFMPS